ncbi:MAG TPA: hypothetical protein VN809_08270, partial [Telmatospirillum sp.]|nr:hypothetical protein [Telmatospirillum sp.]
MALTRRNLLKWGTAVTAASLPGLRHIAFAGEERSGNHCLVVVFLRGGCDGLSLLAPTDDPNYVADRAPELRVQTSGPKPGRALRQNFAPQIDFRLHPEAAPLGELYDAGHLALVHAAGLQNGTRSHFVAQDLMERGLADSPGFKETGDGWVT